MKAATARMKKWRENNKERNLENNRRWRKNNPKADKAKYMRWLEKNRDSEAARNKAYYPEYYAKNKETIKLKRSFFTAWGNQRIGTTPRCWNKTIDVLFVTSRSRRPLT
jgi:hypothetical protein